LPTTTITSIKKQKQNYWSGTEAHAYDLSYPGVEIRRTAVQAQPRQKVSKTPSQPQNSISNTKLGILAGVCGPSYKKDTHWRLTIHAGPGKKLETLPEKNKTKRAGRHGSSGRVLLSKHKALSSNISTVKKKITARLKNY
jgi:hypothetical protein